VNVVGNLPQHSPSSTKTANKFLFRIYLSITL
jgi:hypothetical protein